MSRIHINLSVNHLEESIRFYTMLFNTEPTKQKADYAKWQLDNPAVNFAIVPVKPNEKPAILHLGVEADTKDELTSFFGRLENMNGEQLDEGDTICCYAQSTKKWINDPQGIAWEIFHTYGNSETFSGEKATACCEKEETTLAPCCSEGGN